MTASEKDSYNIHALERDLTYSTEGCSAVERYFIPSTKLGEFREFIDS